MRGHAQNNVFHWTEMLQYLFKPYTRLPNISVSPSTEICYSAL